MGLDEDCVDSDWDHDAQWEMIFGGGGLWFCLDCWILGFGIANLSSINK